MTKVLSALTSTGRKSIARQQLLSALGYEFKSFNLFDLALRHASLNGTRINPENNERLEFLGDRVLSLVIAKALCDQYPSEDEGALSLKSQALVSRETCAMIAAKLPLGASLSVAMTGARDNPTILGNALEALIGAVFVDGGYEAAAAMVLRLWAHHLTQAPKTYQLNPKSFLQEWAVKKGLGMPSYQLMSRSGPDHEPLFLMALKIGSYDDICLSARSRQEAEKACALEFIEKEKLFHD